MKYIYGVIEMNLPLIQLLTATPTLVHHIAGDTQVCNSTLI
jgi:hypothetical protein